MEIWFATHNENKLTEFKQLLQEMPVDVHGAMEMDYFSAPPETGDTFVDNARIKARALRSLKNTCWVVADDSGLVVEGLNGLPGVHSARYAGENASYQENNAKLLKMMQLRSPQNRKAHFVCCLLAYSPEGEEFIFEGKLEGTIGKAATGKNGFGYDPIFIAEGHEKTLAEIPPGEKNQISHRGLALQQLRNKLQEVL